MIYASQSGKKLLKVERGKVFSLWLMKNSTWGEDQTVVPVGLERDYTYYWLQEGDIIRCPKTRIYWAVKEIAWDKVLLTRQGGVDRQQVLHEKVKRWELHERPSK